MKTEVVALIVVFYLINNITGFHQRSKRNNRKSILKEASFIALEQIDNLDPDTCVGGLETVLAVPIDTRPWEAGTVTAITTSNLLSTIIQRNDGVLDSLGSERRFFDLLQSNVASQPLIFGSGIALESGVFNNTARFGPYAFWTEIGKEIFSFDPSVYFIYDDEETEWYNVPKSSTPMKDIKELNVQNLRTPELEESTVFIASRKTGHWTDAYFDCGGGNEWMVTFSSPIFGRNIQNDHPEFKGVSIVDFALRNIDINQCDADTKNSGDDRFFWVFRGTHRCPPTTVCKFVPGFGFRRGGYDCICQMGYHSSSFVTLKGEDVEKMYHAKEDMSQYSCLPNGDESVGIQVDLLKKRIGHLKDRIFQRTPFEPWQKPFSNSTNY